VSALRIVTLCTGNVARSVMLGFMLTTLAEEHGVDWQVRTAGTHVVEGLAVSQRTLEATMRVEELAGHHVSAHRSHQLDQADVVWADVILAAEADHVAYVRARYPEAAGRTVQLAQFCRHAPLDGPLAAQLAEVLTHEIDDRFDVADPAGGDQAAYDACADQLWELAQVFATVVDPGALE
jgi:protein-tyrosine phosphatase